MTNNDALTDIRQTEAAIRDADTAARKQLAELLRTVDTAQQSDIDAYAQALAEGVPSVPAAKARKDKERIKDLELRVIPANDEALWLLVPKVVEAVQPSADRRLLDKNLRRWAKPKIVMDPFGVLPATRANDTPRPADVCDWVLSRIAAVERSEARKRAEDDAEESKREATRLVNKAQAEYERGCEAALAAEEELMAPAAVVARRLRFDNGSSLPWPPFDRYAWLNREGLLDAYGYVQPGQLIQVQGKREAVSAMHAGPAREPTEPELTATEA